MRKQSQQCQESTVAPYIVEQFIWMHCIQPQLINIHRDINIKGKKPGTFFVWLTTFRKLIKALFVIEWVFCCGGTFLFGVESFFFDVGVFVRLTVKLTFYCNCLFFFKSIQGIFKITIWYNKLNQSLQTLIISINFLFAQDAPYQTANRRITELVSLKQLYDFLVTDSDHWSLITIEPATKTGTERSVHFSRSGLDGFPCAVINHLDIDCYQCAKRIMTINSE